MPWNSGVAGGRVWRLNLGHVPTELGDLLKVARQDLRALVQRLVWIDGTVGPDLQHQPLVGGHGADARALDHVVGPPDRRKDGVDGDGAKLLVLALLDRRVALAALDG